MEQERNTPHPQQDGTSTKKGNSGIEATEENKVCDVRSILLNYFEMFCKVGFYMYVHYLPCSYKTVLASSCESEIEEADG